jgi:transcription antitermination protein NusB
MTGNSESGKPAAGNLTNVFEALAKQNSERAAKEPTRGVRSFARLAAVQALYQMDMAQTDIADVLTQFETYRFPQPPRSVANPEDAAPSDPDDDEDEDERRAPEAIDPEGSLPTAPDVKFFSDIVRGVVRQQRTIDPALDAQLAAGWRLARIDSILRAILRAATYELLDRKDVPARVVINDYVDVAHAFFAGDETKVTNAVLDKMARKLRPDEFR